MSSFALIIVFFATTGLALYLRALGKTNRSNLNFPVAELAANDRVPVYSLRPSQIYTVVQDFTDYYNNRFVAGESLTFVKRDYLPYHGGHTITFEEKPLYLQDDDSAAMLHSFGDYLRPSSTR